MARVRLLGTFTPLHVLVPIITKSESEEKSTRALLENYVLFPLFALHSLENPQTADSVPEFLTGDPKQTYPNFRFLPNTKTPLPLPAPLSLIH